MLEAEIKFKSGKTVKIQASKIEMIFAKCEPFKLSDSVEVVDVYDKTYVGSIKHPFIPERELLHEA